MNQPRTRITKHRNVFIGLLAGIVVASFSLTATVRAGSPTPPPPAPAPTPAPAAAAPATPTKVAVIDLRKAYIAMAETKASNDTLKGMQGLLQTTVDAHKYQLGEDQKKLANLKPGSAEYQQATEDMDKKGLQFDVEEKEMQLKMIHTRGRQMKHALDEITAAASEYAKAHGYDIVLVNNSTDLPDNIADMQNQDQLVNLIFARNFLYVAPENEITDKVVAQLDLAYQKSAAPATPGH